MTYVASSCLCCGSAEVDGVAAVVSPFIAAYVLDRPPGLCRLLSCRRCGFRFFDQRFDAGEICRLYANYRGDHYFRARHRFEPWYSRAFNDALGGEAQLTLRRAVFRETVGRHAAAEAIATALDYGGDRGQLLVEGPGAQRFVFELSDATPVDGVIKIGDAADIAGRTFDLVALCHVLEHASEPATLLREIRPLAGGLLFIELPWERYSLRAIPQARWYRTWLGVLAKATPLLVAADLWSTAWRVKAGMVPPLGFAKLHEHLNFFDEISLSSLLRHCGFEVLECRRDDRTGCLIAAARPA